MDYRHLLGPQMPQRRNPLTARMGSALLRLMGWQIVGRLPDVPKILVVAAPHTSNLDGLVALPAVLALDLRISLMAKHSLFRWPWRSLLHWLGLVPVDRATPGGTVGSAIERFHALPQLWLGIAPEGTRHSAPAWKSGFYRIATAARVPILPVAWDYARRQIVLGEPFLPSGSLENDLARLYAFYRDKQPRHPQRLSLPLRRPPQRP